MPVPPHSEQSAAASAMTPFSIGVVSHSPVAVLLMRDVSPRTWMHAGQVEMYVILWEFVLHPEKVHAFVAAYKSDGAWARLFAHSDG